MAECNCGTGSLPIIKQGDAYAVQVSLTFNGEPIVYSDLDLIEEIEFTFGELAPMRFKPKDIYNTTIGAFLVPLTQKQTFMLEDGKILVDCRVQFWGGDVVGVSRMVRVFVREALSWEILPEKPYHKLTPSTPSDVLVLPLTATANGTYTAPSGSAYSPVVVNVPQGEGGDVTVGVGNGGNLLLVPDLGCCRGAQAQKQRQKQGEEAQLLHGVRILSEKEVL